MFDAVNTEMRVLGKRFILPRSCHLPLNYNLGQIGGNKYKMWAAAAALPPTTVRVIDDRDGARIPNQGGT